MQSWNGQNADGRATILFSGSGTKGDLFPLVGIARELANRGFSIVFLTNEIYGELVATYGFDFRSTGTKQAHIHFHSDHRIWNPAMDAAEIGFDGFLKQNIEASYRHVCDYYRNTGNVAVVGTYPLLNGATMAADHLGLPHTTVTLSPRYIPSNIAPPAPLGWILPIWLPKTIKQPIHRAMAYASEKHIVGKKYFRTLNQMRKSFGLEAITKFSNEVIFPKHYLQLAMFPGWYGMRVPDWPTNLHTVGFPLFGGTNKGALDLVDDFIDAQGSPLVFTSGTGIMDSGLLFSEARKICDSLAIPGLFVGSVDSRNEFHDDRYLQVDYVDFKHVLPRCRLIVHHGGVGTLAEAIRAGIPQLIRPLAFDQFDNADRVHRLGLGTFLLPKHFQEQAVTKAIQALLAYRQSSDTIDTFSTVVNGDQAIPRACDLIGQHLSSYKMETCT